MERFERLAVSEDIGSTLPRFGVPTWVGRSLLGEGSGGCPCPPKPFNVLFPKSFADVISPPVTCDSLTKTYSHKFSINFRHLHESNLAPYEHMWF